MCPRINHFTMDIRPLAPLPLQALAQSIADGEAVLILGPDAIPLYHAGKNDADPA